MQLTAYRGSQKEERVSTKKVNNPLMDIKAKELCQMTALFCTADVFRCTWKNRFMIVTNSSALTYSSFCIESVMSRTPWNLHSQGHIYYVV
ncbi:hypothetical protein XELAEV_18031716mg [Xenopus laevis]|uniref:Uncharacterized protein n=1 Tax=Xenopus laevis TaxID=8355 RepID=A0A974CNT9_XENLA|nr:hypothetical protein XELAEV_18031716mg [Xenopus laevis]